MAIDLPALSPDETLLEKLNSSNLFGASVDYQSWLKQAAEFFRATWGLEATFAGQVALLYAYFMMYGLNPQIQSGRRDAAKQKAMQEAWDRGDRQGLKVRPATSSDHTRGTAVDITTSDPAMAARIAKAIGVGDGYSFKVSDPVHFFKKA